MEEKFKNILIEVQHDLKRVNKDLSDLNNIKQRVKEGMEKLEREINDYLSDFNRDTYKVYDNLLRLNNLAAKLMIYRGIGYESTSAEYSFILALYEMINGRTDLALESFENYFKEANNDNAKITCSAFYLCAMICYNKGQYNNAKDYFSKSAQLYFSLYNEQDFQAMIYVCECMHFAGEKRETIDHEFLHVEKLLNKSKQTMDSDEAIKLENHFITLNLKHGNCFFQSFLKLSNNSDTSEIRNIMIDNDQALKYYQTILDYTGFYSKKKLDTILKIVMMYSLAQAMYSSKRTVDSRFPGGLYELFLDIFDQLKNLLIDKTEGLILAQFYYLLGTCALYSYFVPVDQALLYFEYARKQTQLIPATTKYFSCMTKELLTRNQFIEQIDQCINLLKSSRMR